MSEQLLCEIRFAIDESRESPGRLEGCLVTYERRAADRPEIVKANAFRWPAAGIVINAQHDRRSAVVRAVPFVDGLDLRIDAKLPDTSAGRDAAVNVREGLWTGLSTEFHAEQTARVGGVREIRQALLTAAALVDLPSYAEAKVEVRQRYWQIDREILRWL